MNLPNKITIFRVCMIPVFLCLYLPVPFGDTPSRYAALCVFIIASASDALDGYIARSRNLVTNFGKLMDPLADKLLVSAALVAMVETQTLPAWVAVVIISREFFISGYRQLALERQIVMAASFWGKIKTIVQMIMIIFLLFPGFNETSTPYAAVKWALVGVSVLLTMVSAFEYVAKNKGVLGNT